MRITTVGSGSSGNCYIIEVDGEYLVLECGMKDRDILKALNFQTSKINACLISHGHQDHSQYIRECLRYGFPIYASEQVSADIANTYGVHIRAMKRMKVNRISNGEVIPFRVPHNETECDGFYIRFRNHHILFITDAEMCPFNLSKLEINHILVECNYSAEYVDIDAPNKHHVFHGHMELQTCKRFLRTINGELLKSIGLIHLSADNSDPEQFKAEIETEFPNVTVWVAENGSSIELPDLEV